MIHLKLQVPYVLNLNPVKRNQFYHGRYKRSALENRLPPLPYKTWLGFYQYMDIVLSVVDAGNSELTAADYFEHYLLTNAPELVEYYKIDRELAHKMYHAI